MTLATGTRLGTFEVEEPIGSGGMGEVYRARDLKLGRAVAIKVLPEHLGDDPDVRARFEREARAVAALSHPNILAIHHLGDADGRWYAVTELLQGQTLGDRLRQGALPLQKLLRIGRSIAEGLGAAHAQGVIHRDLKPDNVFLTNDGRVKILDFGLARWAGDDAESADPHSPTRPGVVLGTAGYLSPEQVRAETLDERSDIFGLGCLLYEMLTGHPAFLRGSTVESVVAVLQEDPPPFPPDAPADLCQLITSCMEKNREERLQKAHDVALFLDAVAARTRDSRPLSGVQAELLPERPSPWRRRVPALLAAVAAVPLAFVAGLLLRPAAGTPPELRYLTHSGRDRSPAASPDGRLVAFTSERDGRPRIWLEQLPGGDETPLTDGPDDFPRFSPDGGAILFARREGLNASLFRVPTLGGQPRRVVDDATDGDFSPDGSRIAFVRWKNNGGRMDSIVGIAHADGGTPQQLAVLPGRTLFHPRWSPDGKEIAVVESGESPRMALMVVDAEDGSVRELSGWSPEGVLSAPLWSRGGQSVVLAVSGSLAARQGASTRVVEVPRRGGGARTLFWNPALSAVLDRLGDSAVVIEARIPRTDLVEIGLGGEGRGRLTRGNSNDRQPVYSPDGTRIVFSSNRSGNLDVWAHELATGSVRRLTDHPGDDWDPAVMPDGRILWSSNRSGHFEVWIAEPDGARPRQLSTRRLPRREPDGDAGWEVDRLQLAAAREARRLAHARRRQRRQADRARQHAAARGVARRQVGPLLDGHPPRPPLGAHRQARRLGRRALRHLAVVRRRPRPLDARRHRDRLQRIGTERKAGCLRPAVPRGAGHDRGAADACRPGPRALGELVRLRAGRKSLDRGAGRRGLAPDDRAGRGRRVSSIMRGCAIVAAPCRQSITAWKKALGSSCGISPVDPLLSAAPHGSRSR